MKLSKNSKLPMTIYTTDKRLLLIQLEDSRFSNSPSPNDLKLVLLSTNRNK
jgi:hypothetical protein